MPVAISALLLSIPLEEVENILDDIAACNVENATFLNLYIARFDFYLVASFWDFIFGHNISIDRFSENASMINTPKVTLFSPIIPARAGLFLGPDHGILIVHNGNLSSSASGGTW